MILVSIIEGFQVRPTQWRRQQIFRRCSVTEIQDGRHQKSLKRGQMFNFLQKCSKNCVSIDYGVYKYARHSDGI